MDKSIAGKRKSYLSGELTEEAAGRNPLALFARWMEDAHEAGVEEANAMAVATAAPDGDPSVRMVLLREYGENGFVFYSNYRSAKAQDLAANPRAEAVLWWTQLERQVRVRGPVEQLGQEENARYFNSRPRGHRLGAWASPQSQTIADRAALEERLAEVEALFPGDVPLPDFWGGYRIVPDRVEFWQGRDNRLHDRLRFEKRQGEWFVERLAP